jgi:pimeloyl-ACP methyl ester carboxylesterase
VKDLALSDVSVTEKALKFSIKSAGAAWDMKVAADGNTAVGVLRQGAQLKTTMRRLAAGEAPATSLKRPQEPKAPFPYDTIEVTFENKAAGATFAGTLSVPRGTGPFPCALMVTGSGPQDRDETLLGHRPFFVIADHLTRNGIAVLRYDDRGVGKSTGKFAGSTSDDFAEDALAGVEFLKTRKEVDARKIGIVGHSEGGVIAPMCAARSADVAFVVLLAGTGMSGAELLPIQTKLISIAAGMPAAEAEAQAQDMIAVFALMAAGKSEAEVTAHIRALALKQLESAPGNKDTPRARLEEQADKTAKDQGAQMFTPWFKRFIALDPRQNLEKVKCPVLAVNGEKDLQVPSKENLPRIEKALKDSGNKT